MGTDLKRVLFLYLGRRGALSHFSRELGLSARDAPGVEATLCVSRQNERFETFSCLGNALFPVDTFTRSGGAFVNLTRVHALRRTLTERIRQDRIGIVVNLMPHVWSPLLVPAVRKAGARYVGIVHDAAAHPGDSTGVINRWLLREAVTADTVVTLSAAVAARLVADRVVPAQKIVTLFHPDLQLGPLATLQGPRDGEPLRLLFIGRMLAYKGLPLLMEAAELLRAKGVVVHLGVYGEGDIETLKPRLAGLNAEVVNRWLSEEEIGITVARYHAVALPYVEASQSGVAAVAFGSGVPVVATPVGGLAEQVEDGVNGVLAERVDAEALAAAIMRLRDPALYARLSLGLRERRTQRSMARFTSELIARVL